MKRFSYEFLPYTTSDDELWTDDTYAIFDAKLGFDEENAIAWCLDRYEVERIVDALNASVAEPPRKREIADLFRDLLG